MGKILVHEFTTLDGVIDTPTWTADYGFDPAMGEAIGAAIGRCTAILLGRKTFEMFAQSWPQRTVDDDPGAPFFNDTTKYVVSSTLSDPQWQNSTVVGAYDADTIRKLKNESDGVMFVSGSATLVRALLADGLIDELHLFVYPLTRGAADERLFPADGPAVELTLDACDHYPNGAVHLEYSVK